MEYQAILASDGYRRGFELYGRYGDDWALVPEASHLLFNTSAEALAFAEELENEDDQQRYEAETSDLSDDRDALASAGFIEEA